LVSIRGVLFLTPPLAGGILNLNPTPYYGGGEEEKMEYITTETPEGVECAYEFNGRGLFVSTDERYFVGACQDGAPVGNLEEIICTPRERARIYRALFVPLSVQMDTLTRRFFRGAA